MSVDEQIAEPVRLSVCIPTYNFGAFIGETLESVLSQAVKGVEVVVLDGGSTDETCDVVADFQARYPSLVRYERRSKRGGIDRDLDRTIACARGEYCWIFCADDIMRPGSIEHVLAHITTGLDVYICGLTLCDPDLRPIKKHPVVALNTDATFQLGDERQRQRYFALAQTTTALFSFAGSLIVRRAKWDTRELDEDFVGSCWAHVARFFSMVPDGLNLGVIADSYLYKRCVATDSFSDDGAVRRVALAVDGYNRLADVFFGSSSVEAYHIRRVLANEYSPLVLIHTRSQARAERPEDLALLDQLAERIYSDRSVANWLRCLAYRATRSAAYEWTRSVYLAARRRVRSCGRLASPR